MNDSVSVEYEHGYFMVRRRGDVAAVPFWLGQYIKELQAEVYRDSSLSSEGEVS